MLNVIENRNERVQVLTDAYALSTRALIVSALVGTPRHQGSVRQYKDGLLTSSGTFQRYFQQDELAQLTQSVTGAHAHAVSKGIFLAFSSQEAEQAYIAARLSRGRRALTTPRRSLDQLTDPEQKIVDQFWAKSLELGRAPLIKELEDQVDIRPILGEPKRALAILLDEKGQGDYLKAQESRRNDLLVETALSFFGARLVFKDLPSALQADVRTLFGGIRQITEFAKGLIVFHRQHRKHTT